ncbi:OmpH family outer membrane protein [Yoonia sp.]|uniref:OmpH family outer membrane protein n=1 Tax=Yoonia sp. TaxID=2212373 RepID=UPI0023B7072C
MHWLRAFLIWVVLAVPAAAQQQSTSVLIIDRERVFLETAFGQRLTQELTEMATQLQAENDAIVATLTEEERSLTQRRPEMTPEEFRAEAAAFDIKVQEVRRVRDAKTIDLQIANTDARAQFDTAVQGIIATIMIERGASLVLDERTAVLAVTAINVTDAAIARIDAELGDGS